MLLAEALAALEPSEGDDDEVRPRGSGAPALLHIA